MDSHDEMANTRCIYLTDERSPLRGNFHSRTRDLSLFVLSHQVQGGRDRLKHTDLNNQYIETNSYSPA